MKNFKVLLALFSGLILHSSSNAQASFAELENNKIMYPSPTAGSLGKYGEYPVSLYNGLVNIGQDIVTVKSGRLALNVSLSYHASGNRPSDIPGWVGLGFSLNAGGVITRIVKDLPDDLSGGFYANNTDVQYLWNNYPISQFMEGYYSGTTDPRSDVYQFNFCGKTGEFVFDWDRHIHFKQQVPFKVQEMFGSGGFSGFKVTTDDGVIYTFDQAEYSNLSPSSHFFTASSWYLTKIENLSGDNIILKYTAPLSKYRFKQYSTRKEVTATSGAVVTGPTVNVNTSQDEVIYLDEIDFNNGKLIFGKSTRTDPYFVPSGVSSSTVGEQKLDLITLKNDNNNVIKQWKLEYFENSAERLKLKNLIVQGNDLADVEKYSFEYNNVKLPLPLPGPNPANPYLSNDVDYWGYYNAAGNGDNRIPQMYVSEYTQWVGSANRSINPTFVGAEMLEKITYPTGGYASFVYEPNDYSSQGDSYAAGQNPLVYREDLSENYTFVYDRDNGGFDTDPATLSFTLTEPTHVYTRYSLGADGPQHAWGTPGTVYEHDYQMAAGTYTVQGLLNTDQLTTSSNADVTKATGLVYVYKQGPEMTLNARVGPGLRIKSISTNDGQATTTKSFEYKLGGAQNSAKSSGILSVFPAFYALLQSFASNIQGLYIASDPINDITEGAPVGYSRVVERLQDNSYIVHYFTTYGDHPDDFMSFANGYSNSKLAHMSSNDFQRGQEVTTDYYNAAGTIQKEIVNSYQVLPESIADVQAIELKPTVGIRSDDGSSINYLNATLASLYYVHSCFPYNSFTTETTYDKDGQNGVARTTSRSYDNVKHLQPSRIETNTSDGGFVTTATSFPDDFPPGEPFIDYMQANHFSSFPIEQVVYKQKGGVTNIIQGNIITYKSQGAGLPDQLFKLEIPGPLSQANFKFSNRLTGVLPSSAQPSSYSPDLHFKPSMSYSAYDIKGNLLQQSKASDQQHSYLWDYNGAYPVAEAVNAIQSDIAYTSFEADGSGGWTIGSGSSDATRAITGRKSFVLSNNISRTGLSSQKVYIVSYWSDNSSNAYTISGNLSGSPVKGKTVVINGNSWTLYTHKISGQTSITINGSGHIDELRLYPGDAQMTTYTFDPLIGMTSACDVGNRISYYEYDVFERLHRVRDQDYNIVKTYDYKYQASSGCGANCYILTMQTMAGSATLGYPVGVFSVKGKLLGNAANAAQYLTLWNGDSDDSHIGVLSAGGDALHFNLTLNAGQTLPSGVTGCRYYQVDLAWNKLDGVRNFNGCYVDFGDGTGMRLGTNLPDTLRTLAPNTIQIGTDQPQFNLFALYLIHSYSDTTTLRTITLYHNDAQETFAFDNVYNPATSLARLKNLRGNLPQQMTYFGGSSYQQASMLSIDSIANWSAIHTIRNFHLNTGDAGVTNMMHFNYVQDFMAGNLDVDSIQMARNFLDCYFDSTFKLHTLKSDWNTYFKNLKWLSISDRQWDREDLSALTALRYLLVFSARQYPTNDPTNNPFLPLPSQVADSIFNQMARGAGQNITNGVLFVGDGGTTRTPASDAAVAFLLSRGWTLYLNEQQITAL